MTSNLSEEFCMTFFYFGHSVFWLKVSKIGYSGTNEFDFVCSLWKIMVRNVLILLKP